MNAPISETTFAANRLRKVGTRNGRHKLDAPCEADLFAAVSVNWLRPRSYLVAIGPNQSGDSILKVLAGCPLVVAISVISSILFPGQAAVLRL